MAIRGVGLAAVGKHRRSEYGQWPDGHVPCAQRNAGGNRSQRARARVDNPEFRALIQVSSASVVVCRGFGRGPFYAGV